MGDNRLYISSPNAVMLCVNRVEDLCIKGCYYTSYAREGTPIRNMSEFCYDLENFFDGLAYPRESTNIRTFKNCRTKTVNREKRVKIMKDEELLSKHGDLGTFLINVQHRQNSSWQGKITWVEKNESVNFRSVWEMVSLIGSALDNVGQNTEHSADWQAEIDAAAADANAAESGTEAGEGASDKA